MTITARFIGNCLVLDCSGKLVLGLATAVFHNAVRAAAEQGTKKIVINLTGVRFLDSIGVGELVGGYAHCLTQGGQFVLLKPNKKVLAVLMVAQLHKVFDIFDDEAKALAAVESSVLDYPASS